MSQTLPSAFLQLIDESLASSPERADLWMMRFDALKSLASVEEFGKSVRDAQANPAIGRHLNWIELRSMWEEMAPGEPFPDGTAQLEQKSAGSNTESGQELGKRRPPPPLRRFSDVAKYIAGPELMVLGRAYSGISVKPKFLDGFAKKAGAMLARPTPLEFSESLSSQAGEGRRVYLKREDGRGVSVEAEHAAAQCYIGSLLGKTTVITANDVDAHALEVASMARVFEMRCTVVVRPHDFHTKPQLIKDLAALDAKVEPVPDKGMIGTDPREGAVRLWMNSTDKTHLILSRGMAPQPHTSMANAFQALIGREAESQYAAIVSSSEQPRTLVAAVGSEADPIGFALPYLGRRDIRVVFAEPEPGGPDSWRTGKRLAPYNGQIREHHWLHGVGRIQYLAPADSDASETQRQLASEDIEIGLEDARAVRASLVLGQGDQTPRDFIVLVG